MSLSNDINTTSTALSDIKDAIIAKGVTPSGNITTYATAISQISGGSAVIDSLSITPTTSAQTITASGGVDGYSPINVSAVTSSIDANIQAENIKNGVTILNVTGNYTGSGSATLITKSITQNGTYNASSDNADGYSSVTVNVSGGGGYSELPSYQVVNGSASARSGAIPANAFSSITRINDRAFYRAYDGCIFTGTLDLSNVTYIGEEGLLECFSGSQFTSVDLSSLTYVSISGLYNTFYQQVTIQSVNISSLSFVGISGMEGAFYNCGITSLSLHSLRDVYANGLYEAFYDNQIQSLDVSSLEHIGENGLESAFSNNLLVSVTFNSLIQIDNYGLSKAFAENIDYDDGGTTTLQSVSFPALPDDFAYDEDMDETYYNVFNEMLSGDDNVTVHFPSNLQAVIGDWDDVTNGFGGTNTTILFDLPSTAE